MDNREHDRLLLENFVDRTSDLIEAIKRNINHEGVIDDKTVLALNAAIIAANQFLDVMDYLEQDKRILN